MSRRRLAASGAVEVPGVRRERRPGPEPHDVVVDVRPEHDAGTDDRHHAVGMRRGPELAEPVRLRLVARVRERRHPAHRVVLGERHGVVRERSVGGRRRGHQHLRGARRGGRLQHVVRAVHVHVVHEVLVVGGIQDEGEMHERVRARALEDRPHRLAVAHVHALELRLRPVGRRWREVADHDPLGVLAARQELDETGADVAGSPGDHVAHAAAD
jgi:hypothetical protein